MKARPYFYVLVLAFVVWALVSLTTGNAGGDTTPTTTDEAPPPPTTTVEVDRKLQGLNAEQWHKVAVHYRALRRVRPDALVFTTLRGKPQSRRNALRALRKAGDAAGLNPDGAQPIGLHDLRASLVTLAHERAATIAEVTEIARHANPKVTLSLYTGLTKDGTGRAAAKLLDSGFGK